MMQILKVLGRVILISCGLMAVAAGGLCTVLGSTSGSDMRWMAMIGVVSLLAGVAVVWATFRNWRREPSASQESEGEKP
uniref:Transmembrane protein n=1 Tax=Dechloromonas aromatica (strain RCB) TaxID=159087 RepID=Q47J16_DECAR